MPDGIYISPSTTSLTGFNWIVWNPDTDVEEMPEDINVRCNELQEDEPERTMAYSNTERNRTYESPIYFENYVDAINYTDQNNVASYVNGRLNQTQIKMASNLCEELKIFISYNSAFRHTIFTPDKKRMWEPIKKET